MKWINLRKSGETAAYQLCNQECEPFYRNVIVRNNKPSISPKNKLVKAYGQDALAISLQAVRQGPYGMEAVAASTPGTHTYRRVKSRHSMVVTYFVDYYYGMYSACGGPLTGAPGGGHRAGGTLPTIMRAGVIGISFVALLLLLPPSRFSQRPPHRCCCCPCTLPKLRQLRLMTMSCRPPASHVM